MFDIPDYDSFASIEPITKGWSSDRKYRVETVKGETFLLRIVDIGQHDQKKQEFEIMRVLADSGVPMSRPVEFGICEEGKSVYALYTWCEGEDAESVLPKLSEAMQYQLGVKAGKILKAIHAFPAPADQESWEAFFNRKVDRKMKQYMDCGMTFDGDERIIAYIEANRHLLAGRPQSFQHGDYHVGNMIVSSEGELRIIDFNRSDYGDPWEEFNRIVFSAAVSPYFATGQIHGYFDDDPPEEFFQLLAFYISNNTLSAIPWAIPYGEQDFANMMKQAQEVLEWFDGMRTSRPKWYLADL